MTLKLYRNSLPPKRYIFLTNVYCKYIFILIFLTELDSDEGDIADVLEKEVSQMKQQREEKNYRFQSVDSRAKNVIFIRTKVCFSIFKCCTLFYAICSEDHFITHKFDKINTYKTTIFLLFQYNVVSHNKNLPKFVQLSWLLLDNNSQFTHRVSCTCKVIGEFMKVFMVLFCFENVTEIIKVVRFLRYQFMKTAVIFFIVYLVGYCYVITSATCISCNDRKILFIVKDNY